MSERKKTGASLARGKSETVVGHACGYPKDLMLVGFGMKPGHIIWTPDKDALK